MRVVQALLKNTAGALETTLDTYNQHIEDISIVNIASKISVIIIIIASSN